MKLFCVFISILKLATGLLPFPTGTTNGYIVALALPIDTPGQNLYMSFNFEANYVLPTKSTDFTQGLYEKILFVDGVQPEEVVTEADPGEDFTARKMKNAPALISRKHVYEMIEKKIDSYGMSGRDCLLRMICEGAGMNFNDSNGVVGSLMHIMLTPSSSLTEDGLGEYVRAEKSNQNCSPYTTSCSLSLLNAISVLVK